MRERPNRTVSKTVVSLRHRGFKSHSLRFGAAALAEARAATATPVSKTVVSLRHRGFKSHSLRSRCGRSRRGERVHNHTGLENPCVLAAPRVQIPLPPLGK